MKLFINLLVFLSLVIPATILPARSEASLKSYYLKIEKYYFPGLRPIEYSIGAFDQRFGMSKEEFLEAVDEASLIWERAADKQLFKYSKNGDLKINLLYDNRQDTTKYLQKLDTVIADDKGSYEEVKERYDSSVNQYERRKEDLDSWMKKYEEKSNEYNDDIQKWNSKGGAPAEIIKGFNRKKLALDSEFIEMQKEQDLLNAKAKELNSLSLLINQLVDRHNSNTSQFNDVGRQRGEEFEEGLYTENSDGRKIDIFEFKDKDTLIRLLAHEMGHALGLDHVDDPNAIMYRLNNVLNRELTSADKKALNKKLRLTK